MAVLVEVTCIGDVRYACFEQAAQANFEDIDTFVRGQFNIGPYTAKYLDDEGDACTLTASTFLDALALSRQAGSPLRLEVTPAASSSLHRSEAFEAAMPTHASMAPSAPPLELAQGSDGLEGSELSPALVTQAQIVVGSWDANGDGRLDLAEYCELYWAAGYGCLDPAMYMALCAELGVDALRGLSAQDLARVYVRYGNLDRELAASILGRPRHGVNAGRKGSSGHAKRANDGTSASCASSASSSSSASNFTVPPRRISTAPRYSGAADLEEPLVQPISWVAGAAEEDSQTGGEKDTRVAAKTCWSAQAAQPMETSRASSPGICAGLVGLVESLEGNLMMLFGKRLRC